MPSTVGEVFADAGIQRGGAVPWGMTAPNPTPGVYVVSLTAEPHAIQGLPAAPISISAAEELLTTRPELRVDGARPSPEDLVARLAAFWLPDEVVLYIGLAGTSVQQRVSAYYRTPLGARSPHAGGWFLKTLSNLGELHVHFGECSDPAGAEDDMLAGFSSRVSDLSRRHLHDGERPIPFANLEWPRGRKKGHGITGARAAKTAMAGHVPPTSVEASSEAATVRPSDAMGGRTQPVTAVDRDNGRIRVPRHSKRFFPADTADVDVELRGQLVRCRWNPRTGPGKERSGVLTVGNSVLQNLVETGEALLITSHGSGVSLR